MRGFGKHFPYSLRCRLPSLEKGDQSISIQDVAASGAHLLFFPLKSTLAFALSESFLKG